MGRQLDPDLSLLDAAIPFLFKHSKETEIEVTFADSFRMAMRKLKDFFGWSNLQENK